MKNSTVLFYKTFTLRVFNPKWSREISCVAGLFLEKQKAKFIPQYQTHRMKKEDTKAGRAGREIHTFQNKLSGKSNPLD